MCGESQTIVCAFLDEFDYEPCSHVYWQMSSSYNPLFATDSIQQSSLYYLIFILDFRNCWYICFWIGELCRRLFAQNLVCKKELRMLVFSSIMCLSLRCCLTWVSTAFSVSLEKLVCSHPVRNWGSVQRLKCQLHRRADTRTNWRVAIRVEHFDAVWPTSITGNPCYFPNLTCILPICTFLKCKMHIWKHWCIVPYLWKRYSISSIFTPVVLNPCHWIFKKLSYYLRGAAQDKLSSD